MIESKQLETLLLMFNTGASTAENDPLLEVAKIETQQFHDLYYQDRIDIVKGIKGAGKTALYRLLFFLDDFLVRTKSLYCIFGVEATGDPVFRLYQQEFEDYSEIEFENFWNIYFIALVYNLVHTTKNLKEKLQGDLGQLDKILSEIGLRFNKGTFSIKDSIGAIQKLLRSVKIKLAVRTDFDPATSNVKSISPLIEIEPNRGEEITQKPLYVAAFRESITQMLARQKVKVWIMLD
ncbi:MAG: hypothetical protein ABSG63_18010, partial [Spirochaetia bacterium]